MKTIFTFIFIVIVVSGGFAQKTNPSVQKSGMFASASIPAEQSFSISKIYPNPVKDFVTVDIHSELTGNIQISLFNILGTEVKKWEPWYVSQGSQEFRIDLSSIKSGVYILKVVKSGQVLTQVLKKN
jgi:hypothetical protein